MYEPCGTTAIFELIRQLGAGVGRGPVVVGDQQMAGPCEQSSRTPVEVAVRRLVREDLVNCPNESIVKGSRRPETCSEESELRPRKKATEPNRPSPVAVEALGPMEVEEADTRSRLPEPRQRETRVLVELEPMGRQMAVEQPEVWIPRSYRHACDSATAGWL